MRTDDLEDYRQPRTTTLARRAGRVAIGTLALSLVGIGALAYGVFAVGRRAVDRVRLEGARTTALTEDFGVLPSTAEAPVSTAAPLEATTPLAARPSLTSQTY